MQLTNDWREFVELLNSRKVEYLVVGAYAVAWHGQARYTANIDFFLRAAPENAARALGVLNKFGFQIGTGDLNRPRRVVQLGVEPNRIDMMTSISGVEFDTTWKNRVKGELDGVPVEFICFDDLLRNKQATGRGKDLVWSENPICLNFQGLRSFAGSR